MAALAIVLLAACSGAPAESFDLTECAAADADDRVTLKAEDGVYNVPCIAAPAGKAFTIYFASLDPTDHNVAICESAAKADEKFMGETIFFSEWVYYAVEPLATGQYYFVCTVHPEMNGSRYAVASD